MRTMIIQDTYPDGLNMKLNEFFKEHPRFVLKSVTVIKTSTDWIYTAWVEIQ